jgi:hypothetical protein
LPDLPNSAVEFKNWIEVDWHDADLQPIKSAGYKIAYKDGTTKQGQLGAKGEVHADAVPGGVASLELVERTPFELAKLAPEAASGSAQGWLGALQPSNTK